MRPGDLRIFDTRASLALGGAGVALGVTGLLVGGLAGPIGFRLIVGLISFGLAPGMLILAATNWRRAERADGLPLTFVNAVALSFSCNLLLNLVLFSTRISFRELTALYLGGQAIAYAAVGLAFLRNPASSFLQPVALSASPARMVAGALLSVALFGTIYYTYNNAMCGAPIEELVVLRKLQDAPTIRYDNLSLVRGQPATYLFVPFQIFITGVATVGHLDVALVYPTFHAVTTLLGILALLLLCWEVFHDEVAVWVLAGFLALAVGTDFLGLQVELGLVAPCPNRYGFAGGVLLPLSLLMFFVSLRTSSGRLLHFFLLTYLVVEMTFVHARETLFALACMVVTSLFLGLRFQKHSSLLRLVAIAIASTVGALLTYKYVNLALSQSLDLYVGLLTEESRNALRRLVNEQGLLGSLFSPGPPQISILFPEVGLRVPHGVAGYGPILLGSLQQLYFPSRLVLPIALMALPAVVLMAGSLVELVLAACLSLLGLVLLSGLLKLGISAIVGNPEVLGAFCLAYLLAFLLFARLVSQVAERLALSCGTGKGRAPAIALGVALTVALLVVHLADVRRWLQDAWTPAFALGLHLTTMVLIVARSVRGRLPFFPATPESLSADERRPGTVTSLRWAIGLGLFGIYALPAITSTRPWSRWTLDAAHPPSSFTGDLIRDYPQLVQSNRIQGGLPQGLLAMLRERVPPQQVVLSANSVAIAAGTSHFAAILTAEQDAEVSSSYICNWDYIRNYQIRPGPFRLRPFLNSADGAARLRSMLDGLHVDLVVVGPEESDAVAEKVAASGDLPRLLRQIYAGDGYVLYRIDRR